MKSPSITTKIASTTMRINGIRELEEMISLENKY